jgi:hypothetical protein
MPSVDWDVEKERCTEWCVAKRKKAAAHHHRHAFFMKPGETTLSATVTDLSPRP